jgi:hypothetical protein
MDVISHWLWGMAVTRGKVKARIAGPMAVLPDLVAFVPASIVGAFSGFQKPEIDDNTLTADFHPLSWGIYQWSHSLIVVTTCCLLTWLYFEKKGTPRIIKNLFLTSYTPGKQAFMLWLPWFFHIWTDIPSHTLKFFPTPIFHPVSDLMFDGVRWSTPWFWFTNMFLLIAVWIYIIYRERKLLIQKS